MCAVALAFAGHASRSLAQPAPDAGSVEEVVAPQVVFDPGVAYPSDASSVEPVEVALMLSLDASGAVLDASVISTPRPGFDDAALTAAKQLRFEPARRGGVAMPARIGYRYVFEPPAPPPPPPQAEPAPVVATPLPRAAQPAAPIEVTVRGERREPAAATFTRGEVRQIPGAFGDPFRAVEILPGVTPLASGLPFFYVRGAPPGNVAYELDGVRVPYLFHVGAGPAVVQPALIREVTLHPGGYPARFGRAAGGVVEASIVDPEPALHGEGTLRLFDVGGMAETGFADERATVMLGGRYSYTGALLSLAAPEVTLDYRDFQARASYAFTPRDTVSVLSFGAYDFLKENENTLFASEFYRADVRLDHDHDRGHARAAVTLGYDRSSAVLLVHDDPRVMVDRSIALRTELTHELTDAVVLRAGASGGLDFYGVEGAFYTDPDLPDAAQLARVFPARTDYTTGESIDLVWTAGPIELTPGVRVDLFGSGDNRAVGIDPRLSVRAHLSDRVRLIAAGGIAHQPPSFVVPLPGLTPVLGAGLQRSIQTSLGAEADLDDATTTGASLFFNVFDNLSDTFGTAGNDVNGSFDLRSRGQAYGGELFVRRKLTKRIGGVISYTLSRSLRWLDDRAFLSGFDRTHVLNTAVSYDLGRRWRAGARLLYYTGTPKWSEDSEPEAAGTSNVPREPNYLRLDLRLEKKWIIGSDAWLSFVLEFMNATLNKETWPGGEEVGPVSIPSIGLEAGF